MKTPKDNIFRLVNAMSAAEKRYFKRHYSSDKNLLTNLFDFINSMDEYDEELVKKQFSSSKLSKNLKVYKVQLAELLLKSHTSYHNKKTIRSKIRIGLEEIEILFDKQLYELAWSRLKKVKALCEQHEIYDQLIPIIILENRYRTHDLLNTQINSASLVKQLESSIEFTQRILEFKKLQAKVFQYRFGGILIPVKDLETLQPVLKQVEDYPEQEGTTLPERMYQTYFKGISFHLAGDHKRAKEMLGEAIHFVNNEDDILEIHYQSLVVGWFDFLNICFLEKDYTTLEQELPKLEEIIERYPSLEKDRLFSYLLKIRLHKATGNLDALSHTFMDEVTNHIEYYQLENLPIANTLLLYFAVVCDQKNDPRMAQFYYRRLFINGSMEMPVVGPVAQTMELVSHFKAGDLFTVQNRINSNLRRKKDEALSRDWNLISSILEFFSELCRTEKEEQAELAEKHLRELENFEESHEILFLLEEHGYNNWLSAFGERSANNTVSSKRRQNSAS